MKTIKAEIFNIWDNNDVIMMLLTIPKLIILISFVKQRLWNTYHHSRMWIIQIVNRKNKNIEIDNIK